MTADGSTAVTSLSGGSEEPVPAPTFSTVRASPSAAQICAAIRGSVRRVTVYVAPMESYSCEPDMSLPPWLPHPREDDALIYQIDTSERYIESGNIAMAADGMVQRSADRT